jgi:membrane protein
MAEASTNRGRRARWPSEIPLLGWRDIFWRVVFHLGSEHVSIAAAGVAFYAMLSIFPAITAFVSLFGLIADPKEVPEKFVFLLEVMPDEAWRLLNDQMVAVASARTQDLSIGAALGLLIAFWTAGAGVRAMMTALNIAYHENEKRSILRFYGTSFLFTLGIIAAGLFSLGVIVAVPIILNLVELGPLNRWLLKVTPWAIQGVFMTFCLGLLYRYGPSRIEAKTRWVSTGAVVATFLWIGASVLFSLYVANFASYNQTYGALGAVVVLLVWFWISAFVVILGGQLNAEMEHQTRRDTTVGAPKPMGKRGAFVADHVGEVP